MQECQIEQDARLKLKIYGPIAGGKGKCIKQVATRHPSSAVERHSLLGNERGLRRREHAAPRRASNTGGRVEELSPLACEPAQHGMEACHNGGG
eukprot:scaffold12828_cov112-Isochrysis_galbana.AAC.4